MRTYKPIYSIRDLEEVTESILKQMDRALVAAAFTIRDNMRAVFKKSKSDYKYNTYKYDELAQGIMAGHYRGGEITVHAMGSKEKYDTYKTRMFITGTTYRKGVSKDGKPYTKGRIKGNNAVDNGLSGADTIITNYINNAINKI